MLSRKIRLWGLGSGGTLIFAWVVMTQGPLAPVKVTVDKVQSGNISSGVFGVGTLKARYNYNLAPTVTGRVKSVLADQGDKVLAGQVLVEMDPVDLGEKLAGSQRVIEKAVERMMPKESPLARDQLGKLRVYAGAEHPHEAQKVEVYDFASKNPKNKR